MGKYGKALWKEPNKKQKPVSGMLSSMLGTLDLSVKTMYELRIREYEPMEGSGHNSCITSGGRSLPWSSISETIFEA